MTAKTIVLTGAGDGIGAAAAEQLTAAGHRVVLVGRSPHKLEAVARTCGATELFTADYEDLAQVGRLADELRLACPHIDVLANNAGGMFNGPVRTIDGFERTFQVNHLASFLLTRKLLDILLESRAAVVNTSSIGARLFGHIDLDDLQCWDNFTMTKAYGNSKLANILFARGLHQRYHDQGLSAVAYHPGNVATNFGSNLGGNWEWIYHTPLSKLFLISPDKGGANLSHFAGGEPGRAWISGEYYNQRKPGRTNPQAADDDLVEALWTFSAQLLGLDAA